MEGEVGMLWIGVFLGDEGSAGSLQGAKMSVGVFIVSSENGVDRPLLITSWSESLRPLTPQASIGR